MEKNLQRKYNESAKKLGENLNVRFEAIDTQIKDLQKLRMKNQPKDNVVLTFELEEINDDPTDPFFW